MVGAIEKILYDLGLSPAETEVYLELLKSGESLASDLAGRVGNSRTHVYDTLESLIEKALASYVLRNNRRYYRAAEPARLLDYIVERELKLEMQKERITSMLPELLKLSSSKSETPHIEIFEGRAGYKALLRDIIETGVDFEVLNASEGLHREFEIPLQQFYRDRKDSRIRARIIYKMGSKVIRSRLDKVQFVYMQSKSPTPTYIFGDKVAIVLNLEELVIVRVESSEFAKSQREEFELIWNQETKVMRGLDSIEFIFDDMLKYGCGDFIGARGYFLDQRPEFIKGWAKRVVASGFKLRNIVDPEVRGHPITKLPLTKTKYTLKKEFASLSVFWIYGNKVVIANWAGDDPIAFVIENKRVHDAYKQQFELLWRSAKR